MDKPVAVRDAQSKAVGSSADASAVFGIRLPRRKRSLLARVLGGFPSLTLSSFSGAGAVVVIGFAAAWILPGLIDSAGQRTLHRAPVHADHTVLNTHVVRAFPTPRTLVYRDRNGSVHRALVDETDLDRFVDSTIDYLEAERGKIKAQTKIKIDTLLANAFSDSQDRIAQYVHWYFGWGR
jgi:hypothetical protein